MRRRSRAGAGWAAVVSAMALSLALGLSGAGEAVAGERAVRPHPSPVPSAAVDERAFPSLGRERLAAPGRAIRVSADGKDGANHRTIRAALLEASRAEGPSAILVAAGVYEEGAADDDQALRVSREGTVLAAAPGEGRVVVRPASAGVTTGIAISASRVTVRGIALEGFASCGVAIGREGATLEDLVLADVDVVMPSGGDGIAVWPDGRAAKRPIVRGLLVERARIEGADLGFTVGNGPVRDVALRDIVVRCRAASEGASGADAIAVEEGENILVNGCEVSGASGDGIDLKAARVAVVNAYVHDVARNGVKLWRGGDVVNALLHDCGADASIVLGGTGKPRYRIVHTLTAFHNRKAGGAAAYAMAVGYDEPQDPVSLEVVGSVFYRNSGGLVLSKGTEARFVASALLAGANGAVLEHGFGGGAGATIEADAAPAALARAGKAERCLGFRIDPRFADPLAASIAGFRPGRASPLRDAGTAAKPFPTVDLTGAPRVKGAAPDLGPLEGE